MKNTIKERYNLDHYSIIYSDSFELSNLEKSMVLQKDNMTRYNELGILNDDALFAFSKKLESF